MTMGAVTRIRGLSTIAVLSAFGLSILAGNVIAGECGAWGSDGSSPWHVTAGLGGNDSLAFDDVRYCIETVAQDGDVVFIPAGTATDWVGQGKSADGMTVPEGIRVMGSGMGSTIIQTADGEDTFFRMGIGDNCWVEGLEFTNGVVSTKFGQEWVVKDCRFTASEATSISLGTQTVKDEPPTGVYHGCEFNRVTTCPFAGGWNDDFYNYYPDAAWRYHVVYYENCIFNTEGEFYLPILDTHRGAGSVVRFNEINRGTLYNHGNRLSVARAATVNSAYRNTINNTLKPGMNSAGDMQSGQVMFFDNDVTAPAGTLNWGYVNIGPERSTECATLEDWQVIPHPQTGTDFMCRDTVGAGNDQGENTGFEIPAGGWDYGQESKPWYLWGNTLNGGTAAIQCSGCSYNGTVLVMEGRDFFIDATSDSTDPLDGGMVTIGALASAPACDAGTEYYGHWATDQGSWNGAKEDMMGYGTGDGVLYQCQEISEGVYSWGEYWTPLNYPHPLLSPVCGDWIVEGDEECDDGNTQDGDGCDSSCLDEAAEACQPGDQYITVNSTHVRACSCNQTDVQAAVDSAGDGMTVLVPEGECVWDARVTFTNKAVTVMGAGIDRTNITDNTPGVWDQQPFRITGEEGKPFRIAGFTIKGTGSVGISINGDCKDWRVDHCKMDNAQLTTNDYAYGVIDHCDFGSEGTIYVGGDSEDSWAMPASLGTSDAVYVEDCIFNRTSDQHVIGSNDGARYVFRYNDVTNGHIDAHGYCFQDNRGTFSYEAYGNTIDISLPSIYRGAYLRGGTGVVFNNSFFGTIQRPIDLINYRSCQNCDQAGSSCMDVDYSNSSTWETPYYPCTDQVHDLFAWNNALNGEEISLTVTDSCSSNDIRKDYQYHEREPDQVGDAHYGYAPYVYPHPLTVSPYGTEICGEGEISPECWCEGVKASGYCCHGYYSGSDCNGISYHPADTNPQDGCIVIGELMSFISRWKASMGDVALEELMEAIGLWKVGTGCPLS